MLKGHAQKELSKADIQKKAEAWKVLNSVLVKTNAEFMNTLSSMLVEKQVQLSQLEEKLKDEKGSEKDNAEYLFTGGYVQCLKDILNAKKTSQN